MPNSCANELQSIILMYFKFLIYNITQNNFSHDLEISKELLRTRYALPASEIADFNVLTTKMRELKVHGEQ